MPARRRGIPGENRSRRDPCRSRGRTDYTAATCPTCGRRRRRPALRARIGCRRVNSPLFARCALGAFRQRARHHSQRQRHPLGRAASGFARWLARAEPWDVVCLQEIKATDGRRAARAALAARARTRAFHPAERKGYSGVAIYAKCRADSSSPASAATSSTPRVAICEAHFAELTVISVYLPSGSSGPHRQASKFRFLDEFLPHLAKLRSTRARDHPLRRLEHRAPRDRPQELAQQPEELGIPAGGAGVADAGVRRAGLRRRVPPHRRAARPVHVVVEPWTGVGKERRLADRLSDRDPGHRRQGEDGRRSTRIAASPTMRRSSSITTTRCVDAVRGLPGPPRQAPPVIRIVDLVLARGAKRLLDGANMTVHAGHKVGLIGAERQRQVEPVRADPRRAAPGRRERRAAACVDHRPRRAGDACDPDAGDRVRAGRRPRAARDRARPRRDGGRGRGRVRRQRRARWRCCTTASTRSAATQPRARAATLLSGLGFAGSAARRSGRRASPAAGGCASISRRR